MADIIEVTDLTKTYASGTPALDRVNLSIREGEILALLGPNGAGKTTLISAICGLVSPTSGRITVGGHDVVREARAARRLIGLVPQEIALDIFETVANTVRFTQGLYGCPRDEAHLEQVLRSLSLWDKRDARTMELSGGMKRRVLIAKALIPRPRVLFLDEPTAGVDVALRREMWALVRELRAGGVTVILTTHYIEEAEDMADRIAVIDKGRILLVEEKAALMRAFGRKRLTLDLYDPLPALPATLARPGLSLSDDGRQMTFDYDARADSTGISRLLADLGAGGIRLRDLDSAQSTLEEVFLNLLEGKA